MAASRAVLALPVCLLAGTAAAEVAFSDRSDALPVAHVYSGGWTHFVGGGVAIFDCNDDRLPDLFVAGGESRAELFVNASEPGGDIAFGLGEMAEVTAVTGAYPVDVDSDGQLDLVVLRNGPNLLWRGVGDCGFEPAPSDWRFDGGDEWTTSFTAAFQQGNAWPTLVFGNYVDQRDPNGPFGTCDTNYIFRPVGRSFGSPIPLEPGFCALSMLISDWKRTGAPDLRISNDRQYYVRNGREQMWRLDPLSEYGAEDGWPEMKLWGMGIASRDLTGDGLPEVMLTSMGDQPLQLNRGGGVMENAPFDIGTYATTPYVGDDGRPSTGWHAEFDDLNNDGLVDLFIAKGNVDQMPSNAIHDPNNLLIQQPDRTFVELGAVTGVGTTERARGAGLVDLNLDGKLDIVVVNRRAPMEVWQNTTSDAGNWLSIELASSGVNTRSLGAFAEVRLPDARVLTQEVTVGGGHVSGAAGPMHFGLGTAESVEVRVIWPGGETSDWTPIAANLRLEVSPGPERTLILEDLQ